MEATRRSVFVQAAALSIAAATPASALAHQSHGWFLSEARAICILTDQVNQGPNEALATEWDRRLQGFLERVERLPLTAENAPIRALAISIIHYEDPSEWETDSCTDQRLAGQLVRSLTGGAH